MSTASQPLPVQPGPPTGRRIVSWIWGFAPAWTLGFGTAPIMIFATIRLRSWLQGILTSVYVVAVVLMFAVSGADTGTEGLLYDLAIGTNLIVGTGHALAIRARVFGLHRPVLRDTGRQQSVAGEGNDGQRFSRRARTWIWAFVPLWTLGLGTAAIMIFASVRLRSWLQGALTAVYVVATVLWLAIPETDSGLGEVLSGLAIVTLLVVATGHALVIRSRVFGMQSTTPSEPDRQPQAEVSKLDALRSRLDLHRWSAICGILSIPLTILIWLVGPIR